MFVRFIAVLASVILISACGPAEQAETPAAAAAIDAAPEAAIDNAARAADIAKNSIIIDTHIDVPYRLVDAWEDVSESTAGGDFDYPRAVAGGLNAPFMSVYTPAGLEAEGRSREVA